MPALRFLTCGSVDEGTPTLVERLLEGKGVVPGDAISTPPVDGLDPTRRQGVTIDVAHRTFHTSGRGFVAIETAGHERDTLGVAAGALDADLAVLLVDARDGLSARTRHHAATVAMLGVRHVVLAVDGMDLAGYDQQVFDAIVTAFHDFARARPSGDHVPRNHVPRDHGDPAVGARRRHHHRAEPRDALVLGAVPRRTPRSGRHRRRSRPAPVPHAGAVDRPIRP